MPTGDDNGIANAYMLDDEGKVIGRISGIETVTMAITEDDVPCCTIPKGDSISFSVKWKANKTSRKTFCRELIKMGFTKNDAKAVAHKIRGNYGNYLATIRLCGKEYVKKLMEGKNGRTCA